MVEAPPTSASVTLETNYGQLEIDLWAKEAPNACRNFIQNCLEGSYDKTNFSSMIRQQLLFCGKPNSNEDPGLELNSKIKFAHRGIVAMTGGGNQFFISLD